MTWILPDQSLKSVTDEIDRQTDRGAGVIGCAFLEQFLESSIQSWLRINTNIEIKAFDDLCGRSKPLSSFSAKIDLGLLLGIYGSEIHMDLHRIRKIRNEFSHEPEPRNFSYQMIGDHCRGLWLPDNLFFIGQGNNTCPADSRGRFVHTIKLMIVVLRRAALNPKMPPDPLWG